MKSLSSKAKIGVACITLLFVIACCANFIPRTQSVQEPTKVVVQDPTVIPTEIPTEIVSTLDVSVEEEEMYCEDMKRSTYEIAKLLDRFSKLNERAANDVNLIHDAEWATDMALTLTLLEAYGSQLANITPVPERYQEVDKLMDQVSFEISEMKRDYIDAIDTLDFEKLNEATRHLNNVSSITESATQLVIVLQEGR